MIQNKFKTFLTTILCTLLCCFSLFAQEEAKEEQNEAVLLPEGVVIDSIIQITEPFDALRPAKAAF